MNKERLLALANFLDTVPKVKFDLASWRDDPNGDGDDDYLLEISDANLLDHACRTTGCAVGWACTMPEFQAQGLSWGNECSPAYEDETGFCRTSWWAVECFFGITEDESRLLFGPRGYLDKAGPENVAAKIRELVTIGLPL